MNIGAHCALCQDRTECGHPSRICGIFMPERCRAEFADISVHRVAFYKRLSPRERRAILCVCVAALKFLNFIFGYANRQQWPRFSRCFCQAYLLSRKPLPQRICQRAATRTIVRCIIETRAASSGTAKTATRQAPPVNPDARCVPATPLFIRQSDRRCIFWAPRLRFERLLRPKAFHTLFLRLSLSRHPSH